MYIVNLFCDASIDNNSKIACGGCHVFIQDNGQFTHCYNKLYIQRNATNNSAEILAIWAGVTEAISLRYETPDAIFRLFSDSKISLYGLRDWMKNWIHISQQRGSEVLISSSGTEVANQQTFIDIYNLIVETGLRIELYHQRGHVGESGKVDLNRARISFVKANKVSPENLGLDIKTISECNIIIDHATRDAIREYISTGTNVKYDASLFKTDPIHHYIMADKLPQYISQINKSSVYSRHDFKGGYNQ